MKSVNLLKSALIVLSVFFFSSCSLFTDEEDKVEPQNPVALNPFPKEQTNQNPFHTENFSNADALNLNGPVSFYKIQESTKEELVSVGSDGNILRWANDGSDNQVWAIYPVTDSKGDKKYRIQSLANKEFMTVGSNGNIVRWGYLNEDSQLFDLKKTGNGQYNIVESTFGENVAVGSNGNILRWQASGGIEQKFSLIPYDVKTMPTQAKMSAGKSAYVANRIPQPKGIETLDSDVELTRGDSYIVSEDLIPATLVDDPSYATKIDQINSSPYYYLVRKQYYSPEPMFIAPGQSKSETVEMNYSFSSTSITQIKQTVSWGIEASVSASYKGATASLKAQYENSKEYLQSSQQNASESYKISRFAQLESPATIDFTIVVWQLMNEYTLYDSDGNEVANTNWENEETNYQISYPTLPFKMVD